VLRDPFTNKPFVNFYATKRVGGSVSNSEAIKLLKFSVS
jgi:HK97 family phage major capsid protein